MSTLYINSTTTVANSYITTSPGSLSATSYTINSVDINSNFCLYMFGTRRLSNYKMNNTDLGFYYQKDTPTYALSMGGINDAYPLSIWGGAPHSIFTNSLYIWNVVGTSTYSPPANIYLCFYHSFFYNGTQNTGIINCICDNFAAIYFNNVSIGSGSGGWGAGSLGSQYPITIANGMNYIRIFAYNGGGPAMLLVVIRNAAGTVLANSNTNWAYSITASYESGALAYNSTAT